MVILPATSDDRLLDELIRGGGLRSVYQPIVDLDSGSTVGYEALARGPRDHPLERPDLLFAAAGAAGRIGELDRACLDAALQGARTAGLRAPWTLFINVEPECAELALREEAATEGIGPRVFVELTERKLTANPVELLHLVARVRARGWGVALDDVGACPASLALLPLLRPDVIKLDLRLVQQRASRDVAQIFSAVNAEAERSGALVLAEGIEAPEHLDAARAFGARLGQGWMLGGPRPLPAQPDTTAASPISVARRRVQVVDGAPFSLASALVAPRVARKPLLIEISKHLEAEAMSVGETVVVLAGMQHARFFTPSTRRRYAKLADVAAFVAVLGEDMPAAPLPGLRGGHLGAFDPLVGEWVIAVVGPHFAACLVARDLGGEDGDAERQFEFVLSHNRDLAVAVATSLMSRIDAE
jgi:EAL domain-containing protein (putative c-di-GMP-specific phosphodiesterase class I)